MLALALPVALAGCASTNPDSAPAPSTQAAEPTDSRPPLAAGATINATAPATTPQLDNLVIALVIPNDDPATLSLAEGVERFATASGAELRKFTAASSAVPDIDDALMDAIKSEPDLTVGIGPADVPSFDILTADYGDWQFLMIGAELPEPTANVTAVIWDGASPTSTDSPMRATADLAEAGMRAGIDSILNETVNVVLYLSE